MTFRFGILPDLQLMIERYEGGIKFSHLPECQEIRMLNPELENVKLIFSDLSEASFDFSSSEFRQYIELVKTYTQEREFKWAILANTPVETAYTFLLKQQEIYRDRVEVFSTVNACAGFLGVNPSKLDFGKRNGTLIHS